MATYNKIQVEDKFLSTPSARRATKNYLDITWQDDISIHALREEGDPILKHQRGWHDISIHALREEGDTNGDGR